MDFLELAAARYSVRKFTREPIDRGDMDKLIKAALLAPTACNRQPQRILVIDGDEGVQKLGKCTECHFDAPSAILVCYDKTECWVRGYDGKTSGEVDASIVAAHIMLEAADLGLGTTWVMHFIPEAVRCEFNIPDNIEPTALLVIGRPAEDAEPSPLHFKSKTADELVFRNKI
ncbi:MAG: nitroreductase family protein [Lachnospiraceae bacterium]|nr:nitroreductase family protein [Ruminococcus sp.]MCM1274968.1 nitroreductase family protein [Lachnospiraceae bacterium]